jgi:NADPH-dependent ferric siderophore reductase
MIEPLDRRTFRAQVARTERTSPSFLSITVHGEQLSQFRPLGGDQAVQLRLSPPSANRSRHGDRRRGWATRVPSKKSNRPHLRLYTVRGFSRAQDELDLELVLHDATSPASAWALNARAGDEVELVDHGATYLTNPNVDWELLVGDESALPAILSILDAERLDLRAEVFLEVPSSDDIRSLTTPDNVNVHWLPRNNRPAVPGQLALDVVTNATLPPGRFFTFVAGEDQLPVRLQRHLVTERSTDPTDITAIGYWRHGHPSPG